MDAEWLSSICNRILSASLQQHGGGTPVEPAPWIQLRLDPALLLPTAPPALCQTPLSALPLR